MLEAYLAKVLGTETKHLNETKERNADLIECGHRFQLTRADFAALRPRIATSNTG